MSKAIVHSPVVSQVTSTKISNPVMIVRISQALEPISHQYTGTQTATPEQPAN